MGFRGWPMEAVDFFEGLDRAAWLRPGASPGGPVEYMAITAWQDWPPAAWLSKPAAKDRVAEFMRASAPLMSWLDTHVGESTAPRQGR